MVMTGCIDALGNWLGELVGTSPIRVLTGLTVTALVISAFLNNTPVVAILTPVAISLARRAGTLPSKLLQPVPTNCCHTKCLPCPLACCTLLPACRDFSLRPLFSLLTAWLTVAHALGLILDSISPRIPSAGLPHQSTDHAAF